MEYGEGKKVGFFLPELWTWRIKMAGAVPNVQGMELFRGRVCDNVEYGSS